jgi:hypothetical protein
VTFTGETGAAGMEANGSTPTAAGAGGRGRDCEDQLMNDEDPIGKSKAAEPLGHSLPAASQDTGVAKPEDERVDLAKEPDGEDTGSDDAEQPGKQEIEEVDEHGRVLMRTTLVGGVLHGVMERFLPDGQTAMRCFCHAIPMAVRRRLPHGLACPW